MSKPANKRLIGIFVLGATALLVIAIVLLGSGKFFRRTFQAVCFFEGSVGGLNVGAPVVFKGVKIGSVVDVVLRYDTKNLATTIPVYVEIDPRRMKTFGPHLMTLGENLRLLIDHGLRARLEIQSIVTGQLQVGLDSYPDKPAKFLGTDLNYPEIPTIPTPLQEITKKIEQLPLEEIIENIATAVNGINRVVNSPDITKTIQSLARAAEETKGLMHNLNSHVQPVSADVQQTLQEVQKLMRETDVKATTLTSSIDQTMKDAQKLVHNIDRQVEPLGPSIQRSLSSIEKSADEAGVTLRQAQQTITVLEGDIGEDSELVYELKRTVKEIRAAVKAMQSLAKALERQPESLLFGRQPKK